MLSLKLRGAISLLSSCILAASLTMLCKQTPLLGEDCIPIVLYQEPFFEMNPALKWAGGLTAVLCSGALGYSIGDNIGDREGKEGDRGTEGPQGTAGLKGLPGAEGPYGSVGKQGHRGPPGLPGDRGSKGSGGTLPKGPDDLCFYFFNGSSLPEETLVGIVTTPDSQQLMTSPITAQTGAFTLVNPLYNAPIGVYHITIIPEVGSHHVATEVMVLKRGIKDAVLKYPQGIYKPHTQISVDYTYYPYK